MDGTASAKRGGPTQPEGQYELQDLSSQKVTWDAESDPENPQNWPTRKKWTNVYLISAQATLSPVASSLLAVGNLEIAQDFGLTSIYTPSLPVALFVLGLGLGPLVLAPLSELYGRRIIYIVSFSIFTILNIGCALAPNITALSILRLVSGMAGAAGPSLGGGSIGDMFKKSERGKAQALYGFGPTGGPVIGGVIGGFIINGTGTWRWLMWVMVIAPAVTVTLSIFFLRETYSPVILRKKADRLQQETGKPHYVPGFKQAELGPVQLLAMSITRPLRLLIFSPVCTVFSIYISLVYGILYLHLTTIPLLFGPVSSYGLFTYGWTHGTTGLAYLGAGIGTVLGTFICVRYLNRAFKWMAKREARKRGLNDDVGPKSEPEHRLFPMQIALFVVPVGLIIFAWGAEKQTPWPVPLLGALLFATGMIVGYVCIQTYLVDTFEKFAASALAATIVSRSIFGCVFSVVGFRLYTSLGYGWGTMVLAFLCVALLPTPLILMAYGPKLRQKQIAF